MNIDNRENYRQEDQNFQNEDKKETINHSITENAEPDYGDDLINDQSENKEFDGDNLANEEFDHEDLDKDEIDNEEFETEDFNNEELGNKELGNENYNNEDLGNKEDHDRPFITG
jgi:hypothetical protein